MPHLIDGHNLIGQMSDISLEDPEDELKLLRKLKAYQARTGRHITVVFDSDDFYHPPEKLSGPGLKVLFAAPGSSADRVLVRRIRKSRNPRALRVITSDREVACVARECGASVTLAPAFADELAGPEKDWISPGPPDVPEKPDATALSPAEVAEWLEIFKHR